ncbi:MAG: phage/plasmid primase, P4 family [Desulforhopalus sp.]
MSGHDDIGTQVEKRIQEEKAAIAAEKKPENGSSKNGTVTSKFVMDCLYAEQLGNGMLYAEIFKDKIVYAKNSAQWYVWDEHTWRRDDLDFAVSAVETVAMRYAEEIDILEEKKARARDGDPDDYKVVSRQVNRKIDLIRGRISSLRKDQGRNNCLKFAHTNPVNQLSITGQEFDMNPGLLGVQNGVVNLKTGELEEGRPSDYILKRCGAEFHGLDVDQSFLKETLLTIFNNDTELVSFMQRLFGYGLTGLSVEHVFPVLIGRGRNGKSVFVEAISNAMGDYAGIVPSEMLLDTNRPVNASQSDPTLMSLKGLRLAIASETDEGRKFSAARVKWLTGGDTITARGLYDKYPTEFVPTHLLVLLTNHEPGAPVGDMAFWERSHLIRFLLSFVRRKPEKSFEREADPDLPGKLKENGAAILAWLVQGCLDWQKSGLNPPDSVLSSTKEYREEEDYIGQFIETCCLIQAGAKVGATDLYIAFTIWYRMAINSKERFTPSQKVFGTKLKAREEFPPSKSNGVTKYNGLLLNAEYEQAVVSAAFGDSDRGSSAGDWGGRDGS